MSLDSLEKLGFGTWVNRQADQTLLLTHDIARVTSIHKDSYSISRGEGEIFAELTGRFSYTVNSSIDLPTTGDWVYVDIYDESHAIIHGVVPRKTLLTRKMAGKQVDYQLIAANVDYAFIVQAVDENFNLRRLERYLVMIHEAGITPIVLLSKCDLLSSDVLDELKQQVYEVAPTLKILAFSNLSGENIAQIMGLLLPGNTYCLMGSSGVGKTTLVNSIVGDGTFKTQLVSKIQSKGKHTTTSRELIMLSNGAVLIDTPGMRELGNMTVDAGIEETFTDIAKLEQRCKYNDCTHTNENGCAVLSAIGSGELSQSRFNSYVKLTHEAAFNKMSYVEKRKKDKAFGKLIKTTLKNKQR